MFPFKDVTAKPWFQMQENILSDKSHIHLKDYFKKQFGTKY